MWEKCLILFLLSLPRRLRCLFSWEPFIPLKSWTLLTTGHWSNEKIFALTLLTVFHMRNFSTKHRSKILQIALQSHKLLLFHANHRGHTRSVSLITKTGRDHMRSKYFNNLPLSCRIKSPPRERNRSASLQEKGHSVCASGNLYVSSMLMDPLLFFAQEEQPDKLSSRVSCVCLSILHFHSSTRRTQN